MTKSIGFLAAAVVMTVLASLLLPALRQAREHARRAVCTSNLRQLHVIVSVYGDDHDGNVPTTPVNENWGSHVGGSVVSSFIGGTPYNPTGLFTLHHVTKDIPRQLLACPSMDFGGIFSGRASRGTGTGRMGTGIYTLPPDETGAPQAGFGIDAGHWLPDSSFLPHLRWQWGLFVSTKESLPPATEEAGIDPARLSAAGYGEYHPIADNSTPEGRARNRRIDIVIMPRPILDDVAAAQH